MHDNTYAKIGLMVIAALGFFVILNVALLADDDLEGENWVVEELVIDGVPTVPLPGTELSAFFDDGELSGVAGCNSFFAGYAVDGVSISIGPAGSTMAFCTTPEGIMEQEVAYLNLLGTVGSFTRDGDSLTLRNGSEVLLRYGIGGTG